MNSRPRYSEDEKQQLLANLEIEVAHRTRQFQSWLVDRLENFKIHQEGHVSRIPKQVRNMTMREFGEKYNGNVQAALRGVQKEKFKASGAGERMGEIDKSTRKRKWIASQETDGDGNGSGAERDGDARASKNARMMQSLSPKKKAGSSTGPGTAQHARLLGAKTPGTSRTLSSIPGSPSPQKSSYVRPSFVRSTSTTSQPTFTNPRPNLPRPLSPSKTLSGLIPNSRPPANYNPNAGAPRSRVPSSSTFNPSLPPEAPGYPGARMPRMDEKMLSINGSPLANPLWYQNSGSGIEGLPGGSDEKTLKRTKSNISIRPDPSFVMRDGSRQGMHSRSNSQASFHPSSTNHSRNNSEATLISPSETHNFDEVVPSTPEMRYSTKTRAYSVTISTKDGHILEFDPLQTSPGALDALEGITDSAKKQAREEMGRLVQAAVEKWKVG